VTDPIESLMNSAIEVQRAYVQACCVDRDALAHYQENNDALMAAQVLKKAFRTNVDPILQYVRAECGGAIDPVNAFRESNYRNKVASQRPVVSGAGGGIV